MTIDMMDSQTTPLHSDASLPGFGKRLRLLRRVTGMKQYALAAEFGIDQSSISRWERGVQLPDAPMQARVLAWVSGRPTRDDALRRLIESSHDPVHLIVDATHRCLAYSGRRAREWHTGQNTLIGEMLWPYATEEIQQAEQALGEGNWWHCRAPEPVIVNTSGRIYPQLRITAGRMQWDRLYLADGTPVRLCTGLH